MAGVSEGDGSAHVGENTKLLMKAFYKAVLGLFIRKGGRSKLNLELFEPSNVFLHCLPFDLHQRIELFSHSVDVVSVNELSI
jgi:hypothetical protein